MASNRMIVVPFIAVTMMFSLMISFPVKGPEPQQGTEWQIHVVDDVGSDSGGHTSLALDSKSNPHMSYRDSNHHDLKYAKWDGRRWITETVDSWLDVGRYTSLALDANDNPHISYQGHSDPLKYARWTGSKWVNETVDTMGSTTLHSSLELDSNGNPHIAYHTAYDFYSNLTYAKWNGSDWSIETADSTYHEEGKVGLYNSLALDVDDNPHISYTDLNPNYDLRYARWNGSAWEVEIVDSADIVGEDTSLALDKNGDPHISYRDYTNHALKYAWRIGSGWGMKIVDSTDDVGEWTSIALDSDDKPHVAYFDLSNRDLKYAWLNGTSWEIETVDSDGDVGYWTSLALDDDDNPHISYFDYTNGDIKYATKADLVSPSEPLMTDAILSGSHFEDVAIFWNRSPDDGAGEKDVIEYDIYLSTSYGGVYSLVSSVPANGSLTYDWTCVGCGEGDSHDYFFFVEANDGNRSTPSPNEAGKFTRSLSTGPNLASVPLVQSNTSIERVLQTVEYDSAWTYDSFDDDDPWKWHMRFKPYKGDLWTIDHTMGVWINVTEQCNLTVAGIVPSQSMISLKAGWNLVGFPYLHLFFTVADLKAASAVERVEAAYVSTEPYFLMALQDDHLLMAGHGFWVKTTIDALWIVTNSK